MDRTGIIVVTLCAILLIFWYVEQQKYAPPPRPQPQPVNTNTTSGATTATATASTIPPTPNPVSVAVFDTNTPEESLVITNARARYTFTSRGGGLKSVELLDYPETVSPRWKKKVAKDGVATLNLRAPAPVLAILGDASLVGDGNFILTTNADGVRAEKTLINGLRLSKEFHLSSNYLVNASVRLENTSDQPLTLPAQEWVIGTATPMGPDDTSYSLNEGAMWFDGAATQDRSVDGFPARDSAASAARRVRNIWLARTTWFGRRRTTSFSR